MCGIEARLCQPMQCKYIGHSHFSHRLPVTCWENPFLAGRDGSAELAVYKYMLWFPRSGLHGCPSFRHMLVCDCGAADLCHGDFLLGLLHRSDNASQASKPAKVSRILMAMMAGLQIPAGVAYPISSPP